MNDETVLVHLSAPINGVLERATAIVTITDTPPPPRNLGMSR